MISKKWLVIIRWSSRQQHVFMLPTCDSFHNFVPWTWNLSTCSQCNFFFKQDENIIYFHSFSSLIYITHITIVFSIWFTCIYNIIIACSVFELILLLIGVFLHYKIQVHSKWPYTIALYAPIVFKEIKVVNAILLWFCWTQLECIMQ